MSVETILASVVVGLQGLALVPISVLLIQVVLALRASPVPASETGARRPALAVLVPAHDESPVIARTLASILPQIAPNDRLVVVADNCSDDTAKIARSAGAEVVERIDPARRGKGYALDHGVRFLAERPPEVLIFVDADCRVAAGSIDLLARGCAGSGRPIQAYSRMCSPQGAGLRTRFSEFAWVVRNRVRPLGFFRLGLPCHLMGTGMAIPWRLVASSDLANSHLVEDMKLGIELARAGWPPRYCPDAEVLSEFPSSPDDLVAQRTRWEHGHLGILFAESARLATAALNQRRVELAAMALDLSVPPLALLALVQATMLALSIPIALLGPLLPMYLALAGSGLLVLAVLLAWHRFGRQVISPSEIGYAAVYAFGKIPLYVRFLLRREVEWVRAKRDKA